MRFVCKGWTMDLIGKINVTPECLIEKGIELQNIVKSLELQLDEMKNLLDASGSYWVGTAGDAIRDEYTKLNAEVQETLIRMGEHPVKLQMMAGIYKKCEDEARQKAEALSGCILE